MQTGTGPNSPTGQSGVLNLADRAEKYRKELLDNVLPFWLNHAADPVHGGYCFSLGRRGELLDTDKAVWIQGRFIWLLSTLYAAVEKKQEWLDLATHGVQFLLKHCRDASGKYYFLVARDGTPLRMRRYYFSECFAAMGLAAYAAVTGNAEAREESLRAYRRLVDYVRGSIRSEPKWMNRPGKGLADRMVVIVTGQTMRRFLGYTAAEEDIDWATDDILRDFYKPEHEAVMEMVGPQGEIYDSFDGRLLNPGHAIEAAWFMLEEAHIRGLPEVKEKALNIIRWMWRRGWDEDYGGMLYFRDLHGKPVQEYWHDMKFWWPQNETEIASLMAWRLTGEVEFLRMYETVHDYAFGLFPDKDYLEWFGYFHRDGTLANTLKGNHWKGPFHIPRMLLYGWKLLSSEPERGNPIF